MQARNLTDLHVTSACHSPASEHLMRAPFRLVDCRRGINEHPRSVQRRGAQRQLDSVNTAIKVLGGRNDAGRNKKRHVAATARAKMSKAQKAPWATLSGLLIGIAAW